MTISEVQPGPSAAVYQQGLQQLSRLSEVAALRGLRVCIVGCTGLIGNTLTSVLLGANSEAGQDHRIEITGIARHPSSTLAPAANFTFWPGSVTDPAFELPRDRADYVVYIAGTASDALQRPTETVATQTIGLERFLTHFEKCRRFVYISSTRVYGQRSNQELLTEECQATVSPMHLNNIYESSKRLGESLCLWHTAHRGCPTTVLRISNVYGPPGSLRSETSISDFVRQALHNRSIRLTGNSGSIRNYICVLDIVQGIVKALIHGRDGEAYNIASKEHISVGAVAELIARTTEPAVPVLYSKNGIQPSYQVISIEKAKKELSFAPSHSFRELAPYVVDKLREAIQDSRPITKPD